jgi:hypothetical protein
MHFASAIESRKGRAWVILIALAMVALLIAVVVVVSRTFGRTLRRFGLAGFSTEAGSGTMNENRDCPVKTKRLVVWQMTICRGCCCGNVERGLPEVPVEWLKSEWRKRGLLKRVQLSISGCVGPCDVPNVVVITSSSSTEWLGNIVKFDRYRSLIEWAVRCRDASEMLTLPREFHECRISPFRS